LNFWKISDARWMSIKKQKSAELALFMRVLYLLIFTYRNHQNGAEITRISIKTGRSASVSLPS